MTKHKYIVGGLILLGGVIVIIWMKNYLVDKGVIAGGTTSINPDPLNIGTLQLQPMFATTINAQPGTTAFPSVLQ